MNHDIIDNRKEKLIDHINRILSSTESARFAVGYFFLSGLQSIAISRWQVVARDIPPVALQIEPGARLDEVIHWRRAPFLCSP
jgi:hypothetical protein